MSKSINLNRITDADNPNDGRIKINDNSTIIEDAFDFFDFSSVTLGNLTVTGETSVGVISATTIISGSTNLYDIFRTGDNDDITKVQSGTNTYTGGTENEPSINISSATLNNLFVSGKTGVECLSAITIMFKSEYDNTEFITTGVTTGDTVEIRWDNGQNQKIMLTADTEVSFVDINGSDYTARVQLKVIQDDIGGWTPTFESNVIFPTPFTFSNGTPNQECIVTFYFDGTNYVASTTAYYNLPT
jgi:hypothetical protein